MSDVKRLLDEATPLPWCVGESDYLATTHPNPDPNDISWPLIHWDHEGLGAYWRSDADRDLILAAVNRLPDYEAAVDALAAIVNHDASGEEDAWEAYEQLRDIAKAALARFREGVPV